ncbi:MAG TPA: LPS export ABC transporter periplasmic protein LptC, partial [Rhizomicrobium sp.]|nr:LPS export ABC transporter periplasmic protein LptC [Rhizomicrobium sp.]
QPARDWSARVRTTSMDALRYTQFVSVMKRALPTAAFAVIAAVLAFFFVARQPAKISMTYERLDAIKNDLTMIKPHLTGADAKGQPFVVTAETAIQDLKNPKRAKLRRVEADLTLDNNGWLNVNAAAGLVDMLAGSLSLNGGIDIYSDSGYSFHSDAAWLDLKKWIVWGNNPVTGQGPMGTIRADRFHYDRGTHRLTLDGHVHMTIIGRKKA